MNVRPQTAAQRRPDNSYNALAAAIDERVRRVENAYLAPKPKLKKTDPRLPAKHPRVGGPKPRGT